MVGRVVKLVIQIPCYNEEPTLGVALAALPRSLPGVDVIEWLVVDDGSTDRTAEVAKAAGVDHVVRFRRHRGLAKAFMAGLQAALAAGADVIVNTDADNQYSAASIPDLLAPILAGGADIVVGSRPIAEIEHFSPLKKLLQRLGSWVVRLASNTAIDDAPSGFRAFTRDAAMKINVFSEYTYTLETIIQAGQKGMAVVAVPIQTNPPLRTSRLVRSIPQYLLLSMATIVRIFVTYRPLRFFTLMGFVFFIPGFLLGVRFLFYYFSGHGVGHVQSVILSGLLMGAGFLLMVIALVVDLIAVNRVLLENVDARLRRIEGRTGSGARHA